MARKAKFPRVEACKNLVDVRHLLSKVHWKSPEYFALMNRWLALCWEEFYRLWSGLTGAGLDVRSWSNFYQKCPSGSLVERYAEAMWQLQLPRDSDLDAYRSRLFTGVNDFRF